VSTTSKLAAIYGSDGPAARPLSREEALAGQRGRLMAAVAAAVASRGYAATTITDIVAGAATSRRTFYAHFSDKLECYLAAYERAVEYLLSQMAASVPAEEDWLTIVRTCVRTYLRILAEEPEFGPAFLVEISAAGETALQQRDRVHDQFADFIRGLHIAARSQEPHLSELPDRAFTALVGAINELIGRTIRTRGCEALTELEDDILLVVAATFRGAANVIDQT